MTARVAQEARDARAVEGGGHHEEAQILPQAALRVERQREAEIGVEGALVKLVEKDRGDPFEGRIVEDHAGEHALGHDFDAGPAADLRAEANPQPDRLADLLAERPGHPVGCRAGGETSRFEEDELASAHPGLVEQRQRDAGRLAGARAARRGPRSGAREGAPTDRPGPRRSAGAYQRRACAR